MHPIKEKISLWKNRLPAAALFSILNPIPYAYAQQEIQNPVQARNFYQLLENITKGIIPIVLVLAVAAVVFTGFKYITAAVSGKPDQIKEANKMFLWTLIGTAIAVGAWALATAVVNFAKTL